MISTKILRAAVVLASAAVSPLGTLAQANDITYVTVSEVFLADDSTKVADMAALHNNREFIVSASLVWNDAVYEDGAPVDLKWEMLVDGVSSAQGSMDLTDARQLPTSLDAGKGVVTQTGAHTITVTVTLGGGMSSSDENIESFSPGASFAPLVVVIFFAATTHMVELALGLGIFTGACMVAGSLTKGFRMMLDVYILDALADKDHGYVFLFILFMAGLVGLIEKSGGLKGITLALQRYVKTAKTAQGAAFFAGVVIFFDDYANTLVAGASMRPLTDACVVSREKLAFIVDATAAPIASIVPISSWVGFEISLIQTELNRILEQYPDTLSIKTTGFAIFLETIRYRYYCIFMLFFIPMVVISGRDFGPMLLAERLTRVYGRTDGGPGAALAVDGGELVSHNAPKPETPCRWWNMAFPILMLVFYIFYLLWWTGKQSADPGASFLEIIEQSNSYQGLLWGTMAASLTGLAFYFIQDHKDDRIIWLNCKGYLSRAKRMFSKMKAFCRRGQQEEEDDEEDDHAKILMDYRTAMAAFIVGMEKIFGAMVVLTLAWATGAIMQAVGLNRFFGEVLTNEALDYRMLPTLTFIVSVLIAFATGTSWGTMTIMFPLVLVPAYDASNGDANIFYGVTAAILAGAVAGDHGSPISDTTILSSMASECQLMCHVKTQGPYALMVALWSILVGTIPSGYESFSNGISLLLGFVFMAFHVVFTSEFAINKTGRFDIFTEIYLRCFDQKNEFLLQLKADVVKAYETGEPVEMSEEQTPFEPKIINDENESVEHEGKEVSVKEAMPEQAVVNDVEVGDAPEEEDLQA